MAAPTYFGSASNPADASDASANEPVTLAVTPPANMLSGDLAVLIGHMQTATTGQITVSAAGGQSWSGPSESGGDDQTLAIFWCQFDGTWDTEPSLAFAAQAGTQAATAILHIFRPASAATWMEDTAAAFAAAGGSPVTVTGITPNNNDNVTLAGIATADDNTWGSLSGTGWAVTGSAQYRNVAGTDQACTFAHQLQGTKAATGNVSITPSTSDAGIKFTMAWYVATVTNVTVNVTGTFATPSIGTVTLTGSADVSPTGVSATGATGSPTITGDSNLTLTGTAATSAVGTVSVGIGVEVAVSGNALTITVGTVTVVGSANVTPTGPAATSSVGVVSVAGDANVTATGNQLTISLAGVDVGIGVEVAVTGNGLVASLGTVSVAGGCIVGPTGIVGTVAVGTVTVTTSGGSSAVALARAAMNRLTRISSRLNRP